MPNDQLLGIIFKSGLLAALVACWPWIMKWMRKLGYRDWRQPK